MKRFLSRHRADGWGACLACAGLLMLISFACCDPIFETNDDNGIIAISSGAFTGSPYAGNGYTTYLYGALLKALYSIWIGMPWHTLLMLVVVFFSLAAILKSILTVCLKNNVAIGFGFCVFLAAYMGIFVQYVTQLQYTAVAAFAATGGACLVLVSQQESARRDRAFSIVLAMALLLFSFCLRTDSFWVCMPLLVGYSALECFKRHTLRALLPCLAVLCGALVLSVANLALYRLHEPNWDRFRIFYDLRCELLDYNNTDLMERTATQVLGWPETTVKMLRNWYMLDEYMSTDNLRILLDAVKEATPPPTIGFVVKSTASILRRYPMFGVNFVAFGLWGLWSALRFAKAKQWADFLRIIGTAAYLALYIAYFYGILGRLPERAAFAAACPCYAFLALACLPSLQAGQENEKSTTAIRPAKRAMAVCMALVLLGGAATLLFYGGDRLPLRWRGTKQTVSQTLSENVRDCAASHPSLVYITDIPQRYSPFYTGSTAAVNLVEWGHAMQGSDMMQAKWKANGFETMSTDSLFDPRVRVMVTGDGLDMLLAYLKTLYADVVLEAVEDGAGFGVYRLGMQSSQF